MRLRFMTFVLGLCTLPVLAQTPDQLYTATPQQLAITKVVLAQESAWNKGDLDGYISHYKDAPDTQAILAGPVRGLNNIRGAFHLNYPNKDSMGTLENSEVEVRALGENFGLATGKYRLARPRKSGGTVEGTFTEILEKTPDGWQVIFSETT
ncbi:MAG TPA: DUF4440 domain-containing protein [Acidobacteriaceae bacterium]|jgi:ketosteroid isomerase-like protein